MPTITDYLGRLLQDRYRLDAGLGTGGSAHVFLAYDTKLARKVAVKLLHPGLANDEKFFRRFRAEAQAAGMLNHPNIVQIYDWGEDTGEPFLVLEYLPGGSLKDLINRGVELGPSEVAQIGAQTARGLAYAHGRGLVHRDIKPANLLFDENGVVHITDFGLARALVDASWTEPIGVVLGTARYASPEQAKGESVNERSDVYSLALVCYEALVGSPPFQGDTPFSTLMAHVNEQLPYSTKLEPLAGTILKATKVNPDQRLEAAAMVRELESVAQQLPPPRIDIAPQLFEESGPQYSDDITTHQATDTAVITIADVEPPAPATRKPRKNSGRRLLTYWRKRTVRWAVIIVLLIIVLGGGAIGYVRFGVYGHVVPKLVGATTTSAQKLLKQAGISLGHVSQTYSATPDGEIVTQTIAPGSHVASGALVNVVISKGHAPVPVPSVVGKTQAAATSALKQAHFVVHVAQDYNETVAVGTVISETPPSGNVPFGSPVTLLISRGPQPRTIPNVVGMPYAAAKKALVALRLGAKQTRQYSSTVARGLVISTNPATGTGGIPVGTVVTVDVSRGPQYVTVPAVAGEAISDAIAALQAAGLTVAEQIGPPFATMATTTNPPPGSQVLPGSSVTLYAA